MNHFETLIHSIGNIQSYTDENRMLWFNASDLVKALGLNRSAVSRINEKFRRHDVFEVPGNNRKASAVNYAGFLKLVLKSTKPAAEEFSDWVAETVLPCVMKFGFYIMGLENLTEEQAMEVVREMSPEVAKVAQLEAENSRLAAGKEKLTVWLIEEEDRYEQKCAENRALKEQAAETERKLNDPAFLAQRLTEVKERRASEDAACQRAYEDKRRVYMNEQACAEPAPDQLGYDIRSGLVMRPAEFVAIDHDSTRHDD